MILLSNLFNALATGELSGTTIGSSGSIAEDDYATIVSHLNLGLLDLYSRFNLRQKEVQIQQHADVTLYQLNVEYLGDSDSLDDTVYLVYDEDDPFNDDLLKILEVYNADSELLPLNDPNQTDTVYTPSIDILKMTPSDPVELITVVYRASHPSIVITDNFDPESYELIAPAFLQEALLHFIAARVFRNMKRGAKDNTNPSHMAMMEYENACAKLKQFGLIPDTGETSGMFTNNGWA